MRSNFKLKPKKIIISAVIASLAVSSLPLMLPNDLNKKYISSYLINGKIAAAEYEEIKISTPDDLVNLAQNCIDDTWSKNKKIILTNDIDMAGISFDGIPYFAGIFDGAGYVINNFEPSGELSNSGFIAHLSSDGQVLDLEVSGNIMQTGTQSVVGGIAGINEGTISNCTYRGVIEATNKIGLIAGANTESGIIKGCVAYGKSLGTTFVGGICGMNEGIIKDCENKSLVNTVYSDNIVTTDEVETILENIIMTGDINSMTNTTYITDIGGICGYSSGYIYSCTNSASVGYEAVGYNIGGIAGRSCGLIKESSNRADIYGRKDVGGIVGQIEPYIEIVFTKDSITKLQDDLDDLDSLVNKTLNDGNSYSSETNEKLQSLSNALQNASTNADTIANGMTEYADDAINQNNSNVSALDSASSNADKAIDDLENATNNLKNSINNLSDKANDFVNDNKVSDEDKKAIQNDIDSLDASSDELSSLTDELKNELGYNEETGEYDGEKDVDAAKDTGLEILSIVTDDLTPAYNDLTAMIAKYASNIDTSNLEDALSNVGTNINNMPNTVSTLSDIISNLEDSTNLNISKVGGEVRQAETNLYGNMQSISSLIGDISNSVNSNVNSLNSDISAISDKFKNIMDDFTGVIEESTDTTSIDEKITDSSENDMEEDDTSNVTSGRVTACTNKGTVSAGLSGAGIAGTVGIESDFDPESDITSIGQKSSQYELNVRCIVDLCINEGQVTCSKNYAAGIVASLEMGLVETSENYADVTSDSGDYVGGVVAYGLGTVKENLAKCELSGEKYVGGIVGYGTIIKDSYSMIRIKSASQYYGAIAGAVEELNEDDISNNFFVKEKDFGIEDYVYGAVSGIDRVSYENMATAIDFESLADNESIPDKFKQIVVVFKADGKEIKRITAEYGKGLSDIPDVPSKDFHNGYWSDTDFSALTSDESVEAIYDLDITTIASSLRRNEKQSVFVAASAFDNDAVLNVEEIISNEMAERYRVTFDLAKENEVEIRFLPNNDEYKDISIKINENGEEISKEYTTIGEYIVFDVSSSDFEVTINYTYGILHNIPSFYIAIFAVIIIILLFVVCFIAARQNKRGR